MTVRTDAEIEQYNVETYEKYSTSYLPGENRHICVKCIEPVSINSSMSNKGHRLICNSCAYKVFGSMGKAFEWVYE